MSFAPTAEQQHIFQLAKDNVRLQIDAGAGAAKTTTLTMVADVMQMRSLYLTFSKDMAEEAKHKFPSHVEVRTTHSLAYAKFGRQLQNKLTRPRGAYVNVCGTGGEIARFLKLPKFVLPSGETIPIAALGQAVKDTVARFEQSADDVVLGKHVCGIKSKKVMNDPTFNAANYMSTVLQAAKTLWLMRSNTNHVALATHDTYLKLYQLSKPDLSMYDLIYMDESQDLNDCTIDIILRQKSRLIAVGDADQQIYGWRGSVNAMEKFGFTTGKLTKSFRFGADIAACANAILGKPKLTGWEERDSRVVKSQDFDGAYPYTVLYRTNIALVMKALDVVGTGITVNLEFNVKEFVRLVEQAQMLFDGQGDKVKHEDLLCYKDWKALKEETKVSGGELGRIVTLIEDGKAMQIMKLLTHHQNSPGADLTLTTAHKSKGREWKTVVMADDFPSGFNEEGNWVGLTDAEMMLFYVGITRAQFQLVTNQLLMDILQRAGAYSFNNFRKSLEEVVKTVAKQDEIVVDSIPEYELPPLEAYDGPIVFDHVLEPQYGL
jgi:hypothetical protein